MMCMCTINFPSISKLPLSLSLPFIHVPLFLLQWDKAIQLSKDHGLKDVTQLLRNAVKELLDGGQIIPAIELYRKAGYFLEAAKLINDVCIIRSLPFLFVLGFKSRLFTTYTV